MTEPPAGTPWWGWLVAVVLVVTVPALLTYLVQRPVRRGIAEQATTLADQASTIEVVRENVQNSHAVGMRDDLDAQFAEVLSEVREVRDGQKRHDSEIAGIRSENRQARRDLSALGTKLDSQAGEHRTQHNALAKRLADHLSASE